MIHFEKWLRIMEIPDSIQYSDYDEARWDSVNLTFSHKLSGKTINTRMREAYEIRAEKSRKQLDKRRYYIRKKHERILFMIYLRKNKPWLLKKQDIARIKHA
jgi:hypothetical protein